MILEQAILRISEGSERAFELASDTARQVVAQADGFSSLRLLRGTEQPSLYLVLIEWASVSAHVDGFRNSDLYQRWSELLRPHFAAPPEVSHFQYSVGAGENA